MSVLTFEHLNGYVVTHTAYELLMTTWIALRQCKMKL